MRKNEPIRNIMSDEVITLQLGQRLSEARKIMDEHRIHHVPVVDGKRLVGILSATDLVRLSFGAWGGGDARSMDAVMDAQHTLSEAMQREVVTLDERSSVRDAATALQGGSFHSVPVVNGDRELVGIVTSTDLIRYLVEQY